MSRENVESFRRGVEAWNSGDFDAWIDQFDSEVEWFALMEAFRGPAGPRRAWESFKANVQLGVRLDDIRDLGESVLALGEMGATWQRTGLNFTGEVAQLVTYRGGKVVSVRDFRTHAEALEAVGLRE
jgi:ketosteroid isomerase-like protein